MRFGSSALLICLVSLTAVSQESGITGKWAARGVEYPASLVFHANGVFEFDSPGIVLTADCTYTFESGDSPGELSIRCESETEASERQFWVAFLSESVIHIRGHELNEPPDGLDALVAITLDKVTA